MSSKAVWQIHIAAERARLAGTPSDDWTGAVLRNALMLGSVVGFFYLYTGVFS